MDPFDLKDFGINVKEIYRNLPPSALYEHAIRYDKDASIADNGALVAYSGAKTGRSPKDKRVVRSPQSENDVWWGPVNVALDSRTFDVVRERARDYLNICERLYCFDGFAGWDPNYQIKVRVICERPYHALFMHTMLIRPTREQLANYGKPDFVIYNAGRFPGKQVHSRHGLDHQHLRQPGGSRTRHPGYRIRRRDEEGRIHGDELLRPQTRRAFDALLGDRRQSDRPLFSALRSERDGKDHIVGRSQPASRRRRRALLERCRHLQHRGRLLRQGH